MTLQEAKVLLSHWTHPLVVPAVVLLGGAAWIDALGVTIQPGMWVELVVLAVVLRTVIFFEFKTHEEKERRLYLGVVKTGESFDKVWADVDRRLKTIGESVGDLEEQVTEQDAEIEKVKSRLKTIEDSPLIHRILSKQHHRPTTQER